MSRLAMRLLPLACLPLLTACGGASSGTEPPRSVPSSQRPPPSPSAPEDEVQVEGLMGTIPPHAVEQTLGLRLQRFATCFTRHGSGFDVLGGRMVLAFRIARSGEVRWVHPRESTVGDRDTERCVVQVARRVRFPRPQGGEAEASWSFQMDPPEGVRPPVSLHASQFEPLTAAHSVALRSTCGPGPFRVTAYVAPGGTLLRLGAAAASPEAAARLDCVLDQVRTWDDWPDPGSYVGKGTFQVP